MTLSTTVIELRVDCITENFGRVERGCLGDMGGVGYCVEFFRQKNTLNSLLTVGEHYGIRAYHYTNMGYIWAVCQSATIFARRKKMKKFLNTPLRISAGCDIICGVDSARGRNGHRPLNCGKASPYGARWKLGNTTR